MLAKNDLRVLSGKFKGAILKSPQSSSTHPMGSREKLALFNMLQPHLDGAVVLDAYAGTGALGIETISRGASVVDFVEKSPQVASIIRTNLRNLREATSSRVYTSDIRTFAQNPAMAGKYDLILADPPYDNFVVSDIISLTPLLRPHGILALSYPFKLGAPAIPGLDLQTSRKYANAGIALYTAS